jgi:uncharacterized FAD-dependent dehydrogenase
LTTALLALHPPRVAKKRLPAEVAIELGLDEPDDAAALEQRVARVLGVAESDVPELVLLRRSLDARRGRVRFHLLLALGGPRAEPPLQTPRSVALPARVLIVGDGPAGMFCAYQLACRGIASVVADRGKPVQPRRHDLKAVNRWGRVDPDSNYCFGEGGAGTYSDGKLYTRSHKRGNARDVVRILAHYGAPATILSDARPHIGSNRLPKVVSGMRAELEQAGVVFRFSSRMTGFVLEQRNGRRAIAGVRLADGSELSAEHVVLATGHSARDVFAMLSEAGVALQAKAFALGVRVEHPQSLINRIQYGSAAEHPRLPNAAYRLATEVEGCGVFSFCMCPGGFVVPAATEPGEVVVNGMSLARRASAHANSGLVVAIEPAEVRAAGYEGALGGVDLQRRIERAAFLAGGGALRAPATRVKDFAAGRGSSQVPESSYIPGLAATDLREVLDAGGLALAIRLRAALRDFERQMPGYLSEEAVLIGVESRTSSPVRVPRDPDSLQSREIRGLYPCGEGAGYAGGIVSAALDGMRVAEQIAAQIARGGDAPT